jgi:hypothetical protein
MTAAAILSITKSIGSTPYRFSLLKRGQGEFEIDFLENRQE